MKLLRFGPVGHEKPGLLDADGNIRDLSALLDDYRPKLLGRAALHALAAIDPTQLPLVKAPVRLGMPWTGMAKFIAVGLNYRDHADEAGMAIPTEPILFAKWTSCAAGPDDDIPMPVDATKMDWEVELGVVIGERARDVSPENALDHVAGYCVVNDVSERRYQIECSGGQWSKGKGFDGFGPIGPYLVTQDEVGDPQALDLWLDVNGERCQTGNTRTMIFDCRQLVSCCSKVMTLEPGDLIATGTPPGVGMGMRPPRYLKRGDTMRLGISMLGAQRQTVV